MEAVFDVHFAGGVGFVGDEVDRARAEGLGAAGQRVQQRGAEALPLEARVDVEVLELGGAIVREQVADAHDAPAVEAQPMESCLSAPP